MNWGWLCTKCAKRAAGGDSFEELTIGALTGPQTCAACGAVGYQRRGEMHAMRADQIPRVGSLLDSMAGTKAAEANAVMGVPQFMMAPAPEEPK